MSNLKNGVSLDSRCNVTKGKFFILRYKYYTYTEYFLQTMP